MFLCGQRPQLPAKKIISDLASRNSLAQNSEWFPFDGKEIEVRQKSKVDFASILSIIDMQQDFRADKAKPQEGAVSKGYSSNLSNKDTYLIRLEDIDSSWIYRYLFNVVTGMNINQMKSFREEETKFREHLSFFNEDKNKMVSETELIMDYVPISLSEFLEKKERMKSILKIMHDTSTRGNEYEDLPRGICYLSATIALEANKKFSKGQKSIASIGSMLRFGLYKINSYGELAGKVQSYATASWICNWAMGYTESNSLYFKSRELVRLCEDLGILLEYEDAREYTVDWFNSLLYTELPTNEEYLRIPKYLPRNNDIIKVIDFNSKFLPIIDNALFKCEVFISLQYKVYCGIKLNLKDFIVDNKIFKLRNSDYYYRFDVSKAVIDEIKTLAILHVDGYFIKVTNDTTLCYLSIDDVCEYLQDNHTDNIKLGQSYSNQRKWGSWIEEY